MTCWALVPIKRRAAAKQRLAGRLSPTQRLQLVRMMLARVIDALRESSCIDAVAFVSVERDTIPPEYPLLADAGGGLNAALDDARRALVERGADELLVLPADLPWLTGSDIDALVDAGRRSGIALATDSAGLGTNALFLGSGLPLRFQFGEHSRARHLEEAARAGLTPAVVDTPGLQFDIDGPEDLGRLLPEVSSCYTDIVNSEEIPWPVRLQTPQF